MKQLFFLLISVFTAIGIHAQQQDPAPATGQAALTATERFQLPKPGSSDLFVVVAVPHKHIQEELDRIAGEGYAITFAAVDNGNVILAAAKSRDHYQYRWLKKTGDDYKSAVADGFAIVPNTFDVTGFVMEKPPGAATIHDYAFVGLGRNLHWADAMDTNLNEAAAKGYEPIAVARSAPIVLVEKRANTRVEADRYTAVGMSPMASLFKFPKGYAKDFQSKLNEAASQGYAVFGISNGVGPLAVMEKTTQPKQYQVVSSEYNSLKLSHLFHRVDEKGYAEAVANGYRLVPGGVAWILYQYRATKSYVTFFVMEKSAAQSLPDDEVLQGCGSGSSSKNHVLMASPDNHEVVGIVPDLCVASLVLRPSAGSNDKEDFALHPRP